MAQNCLSCKYCIDYEERPIKNNLAKMKKQVEDAFDEQWTNGYVKDCAWSRIRVPLTADQCLRMAHCKGTLWEDKVEARIEERGW